MPKRNTSQPVAVSIGLLALVCAPYRAAGDDAPTAVSPPGGLFSPVWMPEPSNPSGATASRREAPAPPEFNPWAEWERPDRAPRKVHSVTAGDWGSLTANSTVREVGPATAWEEPLRQSEWQTDEAWHCPVAGPLFVYGHVGYGGTRIAQQDTKAAGRTGLGCRWQPVQDAEFVVRGGPSVTYTDPLRLDRVHEKSEWLLEVQARWPLLGKIGLEYQATAAPALTPLDHDWMNQDFGVAAPICTGGKVRVGCRRKWENVPDSKPLPDSMQLYFGLELTH